MAHGYLSYQDTRGESNILGDIVKAVKSYLDGREKKEQVADMVAAKVDVEAKEQAALAAGKSAPRLPMGAQKMLTGGSFSKLVGRNPKSLSGSVATTPDVRGGAIVNMGFGGRKLKPEGYVGDRIVDVSATPVNDTQQIVQAVDRLTFVTMSLVAATKEQTAVARDQQNFFEKLARKDTAFREEEALERQKFLSGNTAYEQRALPPGRSGGGGSGSLARNLMSGGKLGTNVKGAKAAAKGTQTALGAAGGALSKSGFKAPAKLLQSASAGAGKLLSGSGAKITGDVITDKSVLSAAQKLLPAKIVKTGGTTVISNAGDGFDKLMEAMDALDADAFAKKQLAQGTENALLATAMGTKGNVPISQLDGMKTFSNLADYAPSPEVAEDAWKFLYGEDEWKRLVGNKADMPIEKALKGTVSKEMTEQGLKAASKSGAKALGKSFLKKIPVIAGIAGIAFGIQRALEGDLLGAGLEITSGILGATGVGSGLSFGIDGFLLARDLGMMPMAKGGILTRPTPVIAGEAGAEGFFPLQGAEGKKTFQMFGDAFIDSQKRRRKEVAEIQSLGLEKFAQKKGNGLFGFLFGGGGNNPPSNGGKAWWDPLGLFTGGGNNNNNVQPRAPMVGPPPPVTSTGDLFDVIASGEGGYESVNRGTAGDTPGGAESVTGKKLADMTVGEVMELQAQEKLFAVGKYQIIPKTMRGFVRTMNISLDDKFDASTQEKFKKYVTDFKRPIVGRYLRGETDNRTEAAQELAREFASIGLAYDEAGRVRGESRYSGTAGNAASISPAEIEAALDRGRAGQTQDYDPNKTYKTGDVVKKNGMLMKFDGFGWGALNDGLQSSNPDVGTDIQLASAETSLAAAANTGGTTIINNYSGGSQNGSTTVGNQVDFGPGNADLGGDLFTNTRIRTLVA